VTGRFDPRERRRSAVTGVPDPSPCGLAELDDRTLHPPDQPPKISTSARSRVYEDSEAVSTTPTFESLRAQLPPRCGCGSRRSRHHSERAERCPSIAPSANLAE
jgi:hypothetical protein